MGNNISKERGNIFHLASNRTSCFTQDLVLVGVLTGRQSRSDLRYDIGWKLVAHDNSPHFNQHRNYTTTRRRIGSPIDFARAEQS